MNLARFLAVMAALLPGVSATAATYKPSCNGTPFSATSSGISSVFGEMRTTATASDVPSRLHLGVDLTGTCGANQSVQAIVSGTVEECWISASDAYVKIRDDANPQHEFVYEHIDPDPAVCNVHVNAGTTLGTVLASWAHLHLQEQLCKGINQCPAGPVVRINPLLVGRLDYSNSVTPSFINTTLGSLANQAMFFIPDYTGGLDASQPTPTPFQPASNSIYYLKGKINILLNLTGAPPGTRRGVYAVGYSVSQGGITLSFLGTYGNQIPATAGGLVDAQTTFIKRMTGAMMYVATNRTTGNSDTATAITTHGNWDTSAFGEGPATVCGFAISNPQPWNIQAPLCFATVIDRSQPSQITFSAGGSPFTYATSTPTVTIEGTDSISGIYTINLAGPGGYNQTSTNSAVTTTYSDTFGSGTPLADGSYTATVTDLAGNSAVATFIISTATPSAHAEDDKGGAVSDVIASSRCLVIHATDETAGIKSISVSGTGLSETKTFSCTVPASSTDVYSGAFCNLTENSTYTFTVTSCSDKLITLDPIDVSTSTKGGSICVVAPAGTYCSVGGSISDTQLRTWTTRMRVCMYTGNCGLCQTKPGWVNDVPTPAGSSYCGDTCCWVVNWSAPLEPHTFSVANTTDVATTGSGFYAYSIYDGGSTENEVARVTLNSPDFTMAAGEATAGYIDVAEIGQGYPTDSPDGVVEARSPFKRLRILLQSITSALVDLCARAGRRISRGLYAYTGSSAIFHSTTTLRFNYVDTVNTDTTTVRIYVFDGVTWSSAGITGQTVTYDTTTSNLTVTGSISQTGLYATLFNAQDSSAPVTSFSIQGSSYVFDQTLFVSTDAFVVLTSTDPRVNGFTSTIASVTYRIDPASGAPFIVYDSSIPLTLGAHVFEYRSIDYAGNVEAVKTTTFTVTAGAGFKTSNTATIPGALLAGFLGSDAKLEIVSQAQNSFTLMVSSVDRQSLVSIDNIGEVGVGVTPQANLNIGAGSTGLQLRSGNSTSSVTSNQITFGYNGDYSMRHLLRTEHSTSTDGNRMDFLVWNTGAASTTAVAGLSVLTLQGMKANNNGSFHVQPVGEPDAEVEVSNGLSTGGGTMQRLQVVSPSSRRFKTDIKDLSAKDEERALADVVSLKHAHFRYKSRKKDGRLLEDSAQALRTGLIFEEAPGSIREGGEALSTFERLVNVEMALKASMRRLEELQSRYERLKAKRKP